MTDRGAFPTIIWCSPPARAMPISATTNGRRFAPGLKKIEDATEIRRRILIAFEKAETREPIWPSARALLTFVIVGGGPTGVEMAGAIAELARNALAARLSQHRPARCSHRAGRGRAAPAARLRPEAL